MGIKVETFVELTDPVRNGQGEETTRLSFRKMRVGDLRIFDDSKGEQDAMIRLVSNLTSIPPSSVESISLEDWPKVTGVVDNFLRGLKTTTDKVAASPTSRT